MKNFLRILIILLTILFFSLIVVSVKYISYKNSSYEIETELPETIDKIESDILVNVGTIKEISKRANKLTYKLSGGKNNYKLINVTCNINALCDFLDSNAENEAFDNVMNLSKISKSQMDGSSKVYNYDDLVGLKFKDGYLDKVEVYDKKYVFDSKTDLYDFNEIKSEFGMGTYLACNEGTFTSYKMIYTYRNNLVTFTSFYPDGRCNICEIENIVRN